MNESQIWSFINSAHLYLVSFFTGYGLNASIVLGVIGTYFLIKTTYKIKIIYSILTLPGTFVHESMHWIMAKFTNGKPVGFSLIPRVGNGGLILGEVTVSNLTWYNAFPIAMAPFLSILVIPFLGIENIGKIDTTEEFIKVYILTTVLMSSMPSRVDFDVARSNPFAFLGYVAIVLYFANEYFKENPYYKMVANFVIARFENIMKLYFG
jgi:hypothetical protein